MKKAKIIQGEFLAMGDKDTACHSQRFFKTGKGEYGEGDVFLGIRVPQIRKQVTKYTHLELTTVAELLQSQYHEIRLFAALLLVKKFQKSDESDRLAVYQTYMGHLAYINNWDIVDGSAMYIVGEYLYNKDKAVLYELAKSDSLWERRVAIISTFYFIKQLQFADTLEIAGILLNDDQDLIHKAVGWMLREVGNRSLRVEEAFLKTHYHNMPRTMLRYAIEKFPEDKRQAWLKGKI